MVFVIAKVRVKISRATNAPILLQFNARSLYQLSLISHSQLSHMLDLPERRWRNGLHACLRSWRIGYISALSKWFSSRV